MKAFRGGEGLFGSRESNIEYRKNKRNSIRRDGVEVALRTDDDM